ncbi:carbohydrate esterase family 4 protein [Atractiella rhizophila]|nr:carbohydrate esterase family 4 protein [Atractiella rhizophila]
MPSSSFLAFLPLLSLGAAHVIPNSRRQADPCSVDQSSIVAPIISNFPPVFQIATIVPGDTAAQAVWASIQANQTLAPALAIPARRMVGGSPSFSGYDGGNDPDCWWSATQCTASKKPYLREDVHTCNEPRTWGLSFDDGPLCSSDHLYDFLAAQNQKATLCYIGSNVLQSPQQAQRAAREGHEITHHSYSHNYLTSLTNEQLFAELYYPIKVIEQVVGVTVTSFRPPYGDVDDRVRAIANALGLRVDLWSDDTFDWTAPEGQGQQVIANFQKIYAQASDQHGIVVLDHEVPGQYMDIWINQYPNMQAHFTHITPLATCTNRTQIYRDVPEIVFPDFVTYTAGQRDGGKVPNPRVNNASLSLQFISPTPTQPVAPSPSSNTTASSTNSTSSSNLENGDKGAAAHVSATATLRGFATLLALGVMGIVVL